MTQFVVVLDAAIVNVALPSIGRALDFSQDNLAWVVNAYTLTFGGFLLLGGRLADLLGRRKLFMIGLVVFSLASLLGGLAQSEAWLIGARALQGLGAALVSPAALSIVTNTFSEGAERNRALGVWGAVAGSGGAAGVLLGGVLTEYLGWEWVLFVNVPIGVAAALLAPRLLAESHDEAAERSFDIGGAVSVTAGLSLLVYTLVDANNSGWGSTKTIVLGALSVLILAAFVVIERRHRQPLVPFSIFRMRTIRGANIVALLIGMSLFSMFFFISLYMQQVLGYSALKTGVAYLPLALVIIFSAGGASALVTRIGFKTDADHRHALHHRRPAVVLAGLGARRDLRRRRALPVDPGRRRAGLRVRPGDDRRRDGDPPRPGGARVGAREHRPAGRRRPRPRDPRRGGQRRRRARRSPTACATARSPSPQGFQDAFLVGAGFAFAGAILAATLISSRDAREHAEAARRGDAAVTPVAA